MFKRGKEQRQLYIQKWEKGELSGKNKAGLTRRIRSYLFLKHNNACSQCKWSEINPSTGNVPLEIDHIDGDWTNCQKSNLRLLCPNCHSLTPTFRALNKRKVDRKVKGQRKVIFYREFKSYQPSQKN